jgi:adenylate kinase family enzyme
MPCNLCQRMLCNKHLYDKSLLKNGVIVFIGAPLVGKGTQSRLLSEELTIPVISSGDVFRKEASSGSELGIQLANYMNQGLLVPNELVESIFIGFLADPLYYDGFILDGFVRELENLQSLEKICSLLAFHIMGFVYLREESYELLSQRMIGRRILDYETAENAARKDDSEVILRKRYDEFQEKTVPVISFLRLSKKYPVIEILCSETITKEDLFSKIVTSFYDDMIFSHFIPFRSYTHHPSYSDPLYALRKLLSVKFIEASSSSSGKGKKQLELYLPVILKEYLQWSLYYNEKKKKKRTGFERRVVFLVSSNDHKYEEFLSSFSVYGIEVLLLPYEMKSYYFPYLFNIAREFSHLSIIAIFRESTNLLRYYCLQTEDRKFYVPIDTSSLSHEMKVIHLSDLEVFEYNSTSFEIERSLFSHKTPGYIDMNRRITGNLRNSVFGWDDIFVVEKTNLSFYELKQLGLGTVIGGNKGNSSSKISSRDLNITKYIKEKLFYKSLINLKFHRIEGVHRSVDFSIDVADFLSNHPYFNNVSNPFLKDSGLSNVFINVINSGIYFRSSLNRRMRNYWIPGLNSGLPLTPKTDDIHETTFLTHDLCHFGMPDLVFTGITSHLHKLVYIAWRMMSEALTMTIADMAFIDTLMKTGINYDYSKRRIYPLFKDLSLELDDRQPVTYFKNLKKIIFANYQFCLLGNDTVYQEMLNEVGKSNENLIAFSEKFTSFFVNDFKWTSSNYENMCSKSPEIRSWWKDIEFLINFSDEQSEDHEGSLSESSNQKMNSFKLFYTVDEIIAKLELKKVFDDMSMMEIEGDQTKRLTIHSNGLKVIDKIFEFVIHQMIFPLFQSKPLLDKSIRLQRSFRRYLCGQLAIFTKYHFLKESKDYFQRIKQQYQQSFSNYKKEDDISSTEDILSSIEEMRSIYEEYLLILKNKQLITEDDFLTFREVYPLFDPLYLSYDNNITQSISEVAQEILFTEDCFSHDKKNGIIYDPLANSNRATVFSSLSAVFSTDSGNHIQKEFSSDSGGSLPNENDDHCNRDNSLINLSLPSSSLDYLNIFSLIMEASGGLLYKKNYVIKPGILLLSDLGIDHPDNLLTFLIAGISVETSLELIAHKEASVARLTTSKTNAMNYPFYRIYSDFYLNDTEKEKQIINIQTSMIQDVQGIRQHYRSLQQHLLDLNLDKQTSFHTDVRSSASASTNTLRNNEIFNTLNLGNKCTIICYSMTLEHLHKLFLGRSGYSGNESEVREVMQEMISICHRLYPHSIWSFEDYLRGNNSLKYSATTSAPKVVLTFSTETRLSSEAKSLFSRLFIHPALPLYLQLAEFRSRITYLTFRKKPAVLQESLSYHRKILIQFGHLSVLAAYQITLYDKMSANDSSSEELLSDQGYRLISTKESGVSYFFNKGSHIVSLPESLLLANEQKLRDFFEILNTKQLFCF